MLFLAKLDEGEGGNNNADEESDDDEVEDDSVCTFCLLVRLLFTLLVYCRITIYITIIVYASVNFSYS